MKSSMLPSLALASLTVLLLTACGSEQESQVSDAADTSKNTVIQASAPQSTINQAMFEGKELETFLGLHKQYCESSYKTRQSLAQALDADQRFKPAVGFSGVYEIKVSGVSYAVSPEADGCTTDVLVQDRATGKLLFSYEQISSALLNNGYSIKGSETTRKDVGRDQLEVTILEKTFVSPTNEITSLDYPMDRKDQYYMTLFAKKFEPVAVASEVSLNQ